MGTELGSIRDWYEYNSYVRKKYLRAIFRRLSSEERYRDRGASFPSIVDIFVHVLDAYRYWFLFIYNDKLSEYKRLREIKRYSMKEVAQEEQNIDRHVLNLIRNLETRDLDKIISFRDGGRRRTIELRHMLLHVIEEELQHRGELNALFWQPNINPPHTEYEEWAMRVSSRGAK